MFGGKGLFVIIDNFPERIPDLLQRCIDEKTTEKPLRISLLKALQDTEPFHKHTGLIYLLCRYPQYLDKLLDVCKETGIVKFGLMQALEKSDDFGSGFHYILTTQPHLLPKLFTLYSTTETSLINCWTIQDHNGDTGFAVLVKNCSWNLDWFFDFCVGKEKLIAALGDALVTQNNMGCTGFSYLLAYTTPESLDKLIAMSETSSVLREKLVVALTTEPDNPFAPRSFDMLLRHKPKHIPSIIALCEKDEAGKKLLASAIPNSLNSILTLEEGDLLSLIRSIQENEDAKKALMLKMQEEGYTADFRGINTLHGYALGFRTSFLTFVKVCAQEGILPHESHIFYEKALKQDSPPMLPEGREVGSAPSINTKNQVEHPPSLLRYSSTVNPAPAPAPASAPSPSKDKDPLFSPGSKK